MSAAILNCLLSLLIDQLASGHWPTRDRAYRNLALLSRDAVLSPVTHAHLERATQSDDPEVASRAWTLYKPYRDAALIRQADALCETWPWVWLEGHYGSDETCAWVARGDAEGVSRTGPEWSNYRAAARLWAREQLLAGRSACEVLCELARMRREEIAWCSRYAPR